MDAAGNPPPGGGQDYAGIPQPDALVPALDQGQLARCARSGASGTGYPLTRRCGGRRSRSTRPSAYPQVQPATVWIGVGVIVILLAGTPNSHNGCVPDAGNPLG
jgi:hypothetical protein